MQRNEDPATHTAAAVGRKRGRRRGDFTSETAHASNAKKRALRKARKFSGALSPLRDTVFLKPVVTHTSRELLPRILADEIAFRSQIMATNDFLLQTYLNAMRHKKYDPSKTTLTALGKEIRESLQFQMQLIDSTKEIMTPDGSQRQVAGLFARYELLRVELTRRGLMHPDGSLTDLAKQAAELPEPSEQPKPTEKAQDERSEGDPTRDTDPPTILPPEPPGAATRPVERGGAPTQTSGEAGTAPVPGAGEGGLS